MTYEHISWHILKIMLFYKHKVSSDSAISFRFVQPNQKKQRFWKFRCFFVDTMSTKLPSTVMCYTNIEN